MDSFVYAPNEGNETSQAARTDDSHKGPFEPIFWSDPITKGTDSQDVSHEVTNLRPLEEWEFECLDSAEEAHSKGRAHDYGEPSSQRYEY